MSRPSYTIATSATLSNGFEQSIQIVETIWHLTYNGQLARMRMDCRQTGSGFKYQRSCWPTEASGWMAVDKLRKLYNDEGFALLEITP